MHEITKFYNIFGLNHLPNSVVKYNSISSLLVQFIVHAEKRTVYDKFTTNLPPGPHLRLAHLVFVVLIHMDLVVVSVLYALTCFSKVQYHYYGFAKVQGAGEQSKTVINSFSWRLWTNPCRNRLSSFSVGLPRSVCACSCKHEHIYDESIDNYQPHH